jgi:hypothetical protein
MATNVHFRNYDNTFEQNLIDDLVIESIKIYGVDLIYITRSFNNVDEILNEDSIGIYDETFEFEGYVKSVDGFEGEGDFLSRFGLQIRDSITFSVAIRTFERYVTKERPERTRPNEGDIFYFPLNQKLFKIQHVEHESVFYQSGALQVYDLKCELMEYSGEIFQTGRDNIDNFFAGADLYANTTVTLSDVANNDVLADNLNFELEADSIIDFTELDPFSETITISDR